MKKMTLEELTEYSVANCPDEDSKFFSLLMLMQKNAADIVTAIMAESDAGNIDKDAMMKHELVFDHDDIEKMHEFEEVLKAKFGNVLWSLVNICDLMGWNVEEDVATFRHKTVKTERFDFPLDPSNVWRK